MKQIIFLLVIAILLVVSCSSQPSTMPQASEARAVETTTIQPNSTIDITPVVTRTIHPTSPTNTINPTETVTATISPTVQIKTNVVEQCLNLSKPERFSEKNSGLILLGQNLINLENGSTTPIPTNNHAHQIWSISVSPDRKFIAYRQSNNLVYVSTQKVINTIHWEEDWLNYDFWLDNNRLQINKRSEPYSSKIILNLITGEVENELTLIGTNVFIENRQVISDHVNTTIPYVFANYDPTLTKVLYFRYSKDGGTVLSDVKSGTVLADLPNDLNITSSGFSELSYPIWINNGKDILTEAGYGDIRDLYSVTFNGKIDRLTYLSNSFRFARIQQYSQSYDGRLIAFWLWTDQFKEYKLAILDRLSGEVLEYCLPGYINDIYNVPTAPIWSPYSNQFLVELHDNPTDPQYFRVVVVDTDKDTAIQISENEKPNSWLVSP